MYEMKWQAAEVREQKSWPFKNMKVGDVIGLKKGEHNLAKAAAAARAYGYYKGWKFAMRTKVVDGIECLLVKRVPGAEGEEEEQARVDGRSLRRVRYGYEDLEVGEEVLYHDGTPEARKAVSGMHNRARETGKKWASRREARMDNSGPFPVLVDYMVIKRIR